MTRFGLAFVLALGAHVLLMFLALPEGFDSPPAMRGIKRVRVNVFHPSPEPAMQKQETPKELPPEKTGEKEKSSVERFETPVNRQPVRSLAPQLQPEKSRKRIVPAKVTEKQTPLQVSESREMDPAETVANNANGDDANSKQTEKRSETDASVQEAVPLYEGNLPPRYPDLARRRGWEGTVMLQVEVADDGTVGSIDIHTGSSYSLLDNAALEAVRKWRFKPGSKDGQPFAMTVLVPVHFVLQDKE